MPSQFDKRFKRSAYPAHTRNFGEPVSYFFRAGGERHFDAIIERSPEAFYSAVGEVIMPRLFNSLSE